MAREYIQVVDQRKVAVGDTTDLVFSVSKKDKDSEPYIDLRIYVDTDTYSGPTKKGFSIPLEYMEDLIETLDQLNKELESKGI